MTAVLASSRGGALDVVLLILDIGLVAFLIYRVLLLLRGTRALQMLVGVLVLLLLYWLSSEQVFRLRTTHWVLSAFLSSMLIILVIVFQDDIRRALTEVGRNPFFGPSGTMGGSFYEDIVRACARFAEHRIGALIVIAREANLHPYASDGVPLAAEVSQPLLLAIFNPTEHNPLHDGAAIIQKGRLTHAACFLPLTTNPGVSRSLGTRHRAGIGITEETDAVVIIVSEERGGISLALDGKIEVDLDPNLLRSRLQAVFRAPRRKDWTRQLPKPLASLLSGSSSEDDERSEKGERGGHGS